jgi:hypothetical protein
MRRRIAICAASAALAGGLLACEPERPEAVSPDVLAPCLEDEPCWDCETMGNRICGPGKGETP